MSNIEPVTLTGLCVRARPELACLGELGRPLLGVLGVVERVGCERGLDALGDPLFALDVLTAAGPGVEAAVVGRLLDFLRQRAGSATVLAATPAVTVADAVASYDAGPLALMARGTQHTYRTWDRRLAADFGGRDPASVTAGDLKDLIAKHVLALRSAEDRRRVGRASEENAVGAFRHLWTYFEEKGYVTGNVAMRLSKPTRAEPRRRGIRPDEAALIRHLARAGQDGLLDEVTIALAERLGLRRIELCRLRLCDLDLDRAFVEVWGKGDKYRTMPIPPQLAELLAVYVEDRRPRHLSVGEWTRSSEVLLRRPPTEGFPMGRPTGRRRLEELYKRLARNAPELFERGDVSLHSYRHSLATFCDARFGRAVTRAVLGHTSRQNPTDHYVHVDLDAKAAALAAYEAHLLEGDQR
jgi:integrase